MKKGNRSKKRILGLLLAMAMVLSSFTGGRVTAAEAAEGSTVVTVSNLNDLRDALENTAVEEIIVSSSITLLSGTYLNGNGKTISVAKPYITEAGVISASYSSYKVFTVSSSAMVSLENMTIVGGITIGSSAQVTMTDVTVTRSNRGVDISSGAKVVMKNCNIVRNVYNNGGGICCEGGTLIMDGCSLSENRSTGSSGGGGAMEIKSSGTLYMNNCVIANNCSSEIGGAINNYNSTVYLMNTTVTGNVTVKGGAYYGGGIGINSTKGFYAVNCYFGDNYYISGTTKNVSDIGLYKSSNPATLIHCIYNGVGVSGTATNLTLTECYNDAANAAASYREDGILSGTSGTTAAFSHPVVVTKGNNKNALYVPVAFNNTDVVSGGAITYLDYSNPGSVKMSYGEENTGLGGLSPADSSARVTTYYEGGNRGENLVIGASAPTDRVYYTVKLKMGANSSGGVVEGATVYGDSYASGQAITLKAIPKDGYMLSEWTDESGNRLSNENPYIFNVTESITIAPVFVQHNHDWEYAVGSEEAAESFYAWCSQTATTCSYAGTGASDAKLVLTVNAEDLQYTGLPYAGVSLTGMDAWTAQGLNVPTMYYYVDSTLTEMTTTANSDASTEGGAPVAPGTYYVAAKLGEAVVTDTFKIIAGGSCGDGSAENELNWSVTGNKEDGYKLVIDGEGALPDYGEGEAPWSKLMPSVNEIEIGKKVTAIGTNAFEGGTEVDKLTFLSNTPPRLAEEVLKDISAECEICVPAGMTEEYEDAWSGEGQDSALNGSFTESEPVVYEVELGETNVTNANLEIGECAEGYKDEVTLTVTPESGYGFVTAPTVTVTGAKLVRWEKNETTGAYTYYFSDFDEDTVVSVNGETELLGPTDAEKVAQAKLVVQEVVASYKANNATTKEKIEALVEKALEEAGIADVSVTVSITKTSATTSRTGRVEGTVGIGLGSENDTVEINKTIARIETNSGSSTPSYPSYPSATQTPAPTPTEAPEVTGTPTPTEAPEVTGTPTPTEAPEVMGTPKPTKVPVPTMNPAEPTPTVMPNTGWLYIETDEDENAYAAEFGNTEEELEDSIPISQKEANAIAAGEEVVVYLEAEDISESVTEEDKVMVKETIEKVTEDRGFGLTRLGVYLDLNLYKKVGSSEPVRITTAKKDVKIVVKLPEELIGKNSNRVRMYQIVSIQEDEVTVMDCEYDKEKQTLSFASDTFSTCAIIYTDMSEKRAEEIMQEESKQEDPKQEEKPVEKEEPKFKTYTVKKDDFLWKIAEEQLGDGSRYPEIKKASGITSNVLNVGQVLVIPVETEAEDEDSKPEEKEDAKLEEKEDVLPVGKKTYTVKKGDYLWKIAEEKLGDGRRYPEIMKLSGIEDAEILVGQVLTLPEK